MDLCDPFAKEGNDYHATLLLCEGEEGVRLVRVFVPFFTCVISKLRMPMCSLQRLKR